MKHECYFIEGVAKTDFIGFDSYLNALDNSIEKNAKFVGLISNYGTGKSTLIDMLKDIQKEKGNELITINLWNCEEKNQNNVDIHRVFLHQLIDKLKISNKDYYKKKINKRYNILDIKLKGTRHFYILFFVILYLMTIIDKMGFIKIFPSEFSLIGYFLMTVLFVLCILIYKPVIAYKKIDEEYTIIDENDTKDLYLEILNDYYETKNKKDKNKKLIVCLEELDRYNDKHVILQYLKEFYKFYNESITKQDVIFIVSIKSASQIVSQDNQKDNYDIKETYEKIFDFILNLNPINIQDYDSIVWDLLQEKIVDIPEKIKMPNKNNLKNWKYLYKGKNIKIRDIKHRFNFAISLYLSVEESGINADINKCLFLSYMEDEYNELYEKLVNESGLINDLLIKYSNKDRNFSGMHGLSDLDKKIILEGLDSKFISVDYNYYFYKFPKNKKSYNIYEYELYNAIFFDEDRPNLKYSLNKLSKNQIITIFNKRVNDDFFPRIIFKYPKTLQLAFEKKLDVVKNTIKKYYDPINNYDEFVGLVSTAKKLNRKIYVDILNTYFEIHLKTIDDLDVDSRYSIRKKLVYQLKKDSLLISKLFFDNNYIISNQEMNDIDELKIIIDLTNFEKIDEECINSYINILTGINNKKSALIIKLLERISISNLSSEIYKKLLYSINLKCIKFTKKEYYKLFEISKEKIKLVDSKNFEEFITKINYYCEEFDDFYLKIIDLNNPLEIYKYRDILIKFNVIYPSSMKFFNDNNNKLGVFKFNSIIRQLFYNNGYYEYYLMAKNLAGEIYEIEDDKFDNLSQEYIIHYESFKNFNIAVGPKMKEYLYKTVDMKKLDSLGLYLFVDMPQTKEIIESILNIDDSKFVNRYLSNIDKIRKSDTYDIYKLIGEYNRNKQSINGKSRNNLKRLTKNIKCLQLLDARRKKEKVLT